MTAKLPCFPHNTSKLCSLLELALSAPPSHPEHQQLMTPMSEPASAPECFIFLDINGVVRTCATQEIWDAHCTAALRHVIDAPAQTVGIVLTSSWRQDATRLELARTLLHKHALPPLIGCTPELSKEHAMRGSEILEWLRVCGSSDCAWIAIDDGPLLVKHEHNSVQCRLLEQRTLTPVSSTGLTMSLAEEAVRLLVSQCRREPIDCGDV